jgi:hypothetical protein
MAMVETPDSQGRISAPLPPCELKSPSVSLSLRLIRRGGRPTRTRTTTAGRPKATRAAGTAPAHLVERFLLGVSQDLRQPAIDVFLKLVNALPSLK